MIEHTMTTTLEVLVNLLITRQFIKNIILFWYALGKLAYFE